MATDSRRTIGRAGEELAARHLGRCGYRIIDRNFRTRFGELNLVALGRRDLVFCEVKTRVVGTAGALVPRSKRSGRRSVSACDGWRLSGFPAARAGAHGGRASATT